MNGDVADRDVQAGEYTQWRFRMTTTTDGVSRRRDLVTHTARVHVGSWEPAALGDVAATP